MITLKFGNYSQGEIDTLAMLFGKMQTHLHVHCEHNENCLTCPVMNVCLDLNKAQSFCESATAPVKRHRKR